MIRPTRLVEGEVLLEVLASRAARGGDGTRRLAGRAREPMKAEITLIVRPVRCMAGHRAELRAYDVNGGWFRVYCDCGEAWLPDGEERRELVEGQVGAPFPRQPQVTTR